MRFKNQMSRRSRAARKLTCNILEIKVLPISQASLNVVLVDASSKPLSATFHLKLFLKLSYTKTSDE